MADRLELLEGELQKAKRVNLELMHELKSMRATIAELEQSRLKIKQVLFEKAEHFEVLQIKRTFPTPEGIVIEVAK